jgi:DNA-binding NtrC family response regulator
LLVGATGVGKEVVARALHEGSPRREKPFITVDCPAQAEGLIESELFGHKRGSFTGAIKDKPGLFMLADGGTLFLDEVDKTPRSLQGKLLRVLESGEVRPVGATTTQSLDLRVIAAATDEVETLMDRREFLPDLYFRLCGKRICVPRLMERQEDLLPLAKYFADPLGIEKYRTMFSEYAVFSWPYRTYLPRLVHRMGHNPMVDPLLCIYDSEYLPTWLPVFPLFMRDPWPGNIRQFRNAVRCAVVEEDLKPLPERPFLGGVVRRGKLIPIVRGGRVEVLNASDLQMVQELCQSQREMAKLLGKDAAWVSRQLKRAQDSKDGR